MEDLLVINETVIWFLTCKGLYILHYIWGMRPVFFKKKNQTMSLY